MKKRRKGAVLAEGRVESGDEFRGEEWSGAGQKAHGFKGEALEECFPQGIAAGAGFGLFLVTR